MSEALLIGRLIFAFYFAEAGYRNVRGSGNIIAGMRTQPRYPPYMRAAPALFTHASNACLVLGSLSVGLGVWGDLGSLLLIGFLVPVTLVTHAYWRIEDPAEKRLARMGFFRNLGHVGACIFLFGVFASATPLNPTLTSPLLTIR
ncbi:MAG: DoxX family protein [Chloroflexi bacterium]|nr:DoxX family protein [Chloroflexota bacterium]